MHPHRSVLLSALLLASCGPSPQADAGPDGEAAPQDAAAPEDAAAADASELDAAAPDAGRPDASRLDAAAPDAAPGEDAGVPPPTGTVRAQLRASRERCTSPCTVVFSAEDSADSSLAEASRSWHELGYHFDFDDPSSSVYETTGLQRNRQVGGPLAAHTFVCASGECSFRVGVRAQNAAGDLHDAFVTIEVDSASSRFAPADTICVSSTGEFGGDEPCPAGATERTALPGPGELSGRRLLLRRGEQFGPLCVDYATSDLLVEAFGDAADGRPELTGNTDLGVDGSCGDFIPDDAAIGAIDGSSGYPERWAENITLTGLRLEHVRFGMSYTHIGLHDIDMSYEDAPSGGALSLVRNTNACLSNAGLSCGRIPYPVGAYLSLVTVIQSDTEVAAGGGGFGVNIGAFNCPIIHWLAVLESTVRNAVEHNIRTEGSWRAFYGHNHLLGHHHRDAPTDGVRHKLTVRSCGSGVIDPALSRYRHEASEGTPEAPMTRFTVVADNRIGSTDDFGSGRKLTLTPSNPSEMTAVGFGIVERNTFVEPADPAFASNDVALGGHQLACRPNTYSTPGVRQDCTEFGQGGTPDAWYEPSELLAPAPPQPAAPTR